jgi:hypothetical protein
MERARTENPAPKREKNAKIITGEAQEGKEIRVSEKRRGGGAGGLGLGGEGTEDDHMFLVAFVRSFLPSFVSPKIHSYTVQGDECGKLVTLS